MMHNVSGADRTLLCIFTVLTCITNVEEAVAHCGSEFVLAIKNANDGRRIALVQTITLNERCICSEGLQTIRATVESATAADCGAIGTGEDVVSNLKNSIEFAECLGCLRS